MQVTLKRTTNEKQENLRLHSAASKTFHSSTDAQLEQEMRQSTRSLYTKKAEHAPKTVGIVLSLFFLVQVELLSSTAYSH